MFGVTFLIWMASKVLLSPYHSHQHPRTTMGVLRCMRERERSICHPTKMQQKMDHLNQVFQVNGFPENLVKKTLTTHPPPLPETSEPEQQDETPKILCTPYIKGLSEKIAKVCGPLGVKHVFRPKKTLKRELMQVKNRTPEQKQTKWCTRSSVRIAQRCMWEKPRGH